VDDLLIRLDGTPDKSNLGGNATASVSAATLKAGAAALGIPLYQHIGGAHASLMPTPAALVALGGRRYQRSTRTGTKPTYSLVCYGFDTYSEASHAGWLLLNTFRRLLWERHHVDATNVRDQHIVVPPGYIQHDRALWDLMVETIAKEKLEGRVGIQVDVAASTYYDDEQQRFDGLFSAEPKTRDQLIRLYEEMVANYPFVIMEDPLDEDDWEGHAHLVRTLGIEIVGDDLFATNPARVQRGVETGACNAVLLKVNQIGTITESFDMVQLAYRQGYGVMPCDSRGEGADIADYAVGLGTGHLREGALGVTGNRFLQIEAELGARARFAGRSGINVSRTDR
jgi:enolase